MNRSIEPERLRSNIQSGAEDFLALGFHIPTVALVGERGALVVARAAHPDADFAALAAFLADAAQMPVRTIPEDLDVALSGGDPRSAYALPAHPRPPLFSYSVLRSALGRFATLEGEHDGPPATAPVGDCRCIAVAGRREVARSMYETFLQDHVIGGPIGDDYDHRHYRSPVSLRLDHVAPSVQARMVAEAARRGGVRG